MNCLEQLRTDLELAFNEDHEIKVAQRRKQMIDPAKQYNEHALAAFRTMEALNELNTQTRKELYYKGHSVTFSAYDFVTNSQQDEILFILAARWSDDIRRGNRLHPPNMRSLKLPTQDKN